MKDILSQSLIYQGRSFNKGNFWKIRKEEIGSQSLIYQGRSFNAKPFNFYTPSGTCVAIPYLSGKVFQLKGQKREELFNPLKSRNPLFIREGLSTYALRDYFFVFLQLSQSLIYQGRSFNNLDFLSEFFIISMSQSLIYQGRSFNKGGVKMKKVFTFNESQSLIYQGRSFNLKKMLKNVFIQKMGRNPLFIREGLSTEE